MIRALRLGRRRTPVVVALVAAAVVAGVEHGDLAAFGQIVQQFQGALAGVVEPRQAADAVFHAVAHVENEHGRCGTGAVQPEPAGHGARQEHLRLGQGEAEGGQHGHAQGHEKQVLQTHPTAIDFLLLAQEAEGRERQTPRLLTHHQMHKNGDAQKHRPPRR